MRTWLVLASLLLTALSGCAGLDAGVMTDGHGDGHNHGDGHVHGDEPHAEAGGHGDDMHAEGDVMHDDAPHMDEHAGDHGQTGMARPAFPAATGRVPTAKEAAELPEVSMLRFIGDVDLESSGFVSGNGTLADPYVIEGLYVTGDLMLQDTDAFVTIRENWIGGQLTLNWNAQNVHVHHNHIRDLRVNENIVRTGYATGGLLERNEIGYVGQLRHYDGEFRYNTVGPMPAEGPYDSVKETVPYDFVDDPRIANIDGFNQGLIHNNTFHGSVDLDFHGHHHGTGFFASHSHYHGDEEERAMPHDHTDRWTSVAFTDNTIIDPVGYGLRYEDRNHAGDDRTAKSESEDTLELDHVHHTDVDILRNDVDGAGIWIDVLNADDERHKGRNDAWLDLIGNTVRMQEREEGPLGLWGPAFQASVGIHVLAAKEVEMRILDNVVVYTAADGLLDLGDAEAIAYKIRSIQDASIAFRDNEADGFDIGLHASQFEDVALEMSGNDFGSATKPTQFDESV